MTNNPITRNTKYPKRNTNYPITRNTKYPKINTKYPIRNSKYSIRNILYPKRNTKYPLRNIKYQISNKVDLIPNTQYRNDQRPHKICQIRIWYRKETIPVQKSNNQNIQWEILNTKYQNMKCQGWLGVLKPSINYFLLFIIIVAVAVCFTGAQ